MKRFLLVVALSAVVLPAVMQSAQAADVSVNYFYDNLTGGNWYEVGDYGYVWQPDVATNSNWRPYTDGYWAYTDVGWTWVSYEDFGWATYHYGRWARLADYGWVWVPGYEWGPAWVSWRTGGDYVGWAPLPPAGGREVVYESRPIDYRVDAEYDIGPAYYNFIDLRYIGEPVLRDRIFPWNQNVAYIDRTVNVTNITYTNGLFYNYGPDYSLVSAYSVRPVQRLRLERANIDPFQAVKTGNVTKVEGDRLVLAAPAKLQKSAAQIAPPKVKSKIEQPKLEKGWTNIDPATKSKLEQKFKTENPKNIPKPNLQPRAGANAAANVGTPAGGTVEGKGKRKGEKFQKQPGAAGGPGPSPGAPAGVAEQGKGRKNKGQAFEKQPNPPSGAAEQGTAIEQGKGGKNKAKELRGQSMPGGATAATGQPGAEQRATERGAGKGKHKAERAEGAANPNASAGPAERNAQGEGKRNKQLGRANERANLNGPPVPAQAGEGRGKGGGRMQSAEKFNQPGGGKHRGQTQGAPQGAGAQAAQPEGKGKGKKNKGQPPGPPPQ